MSRKSTTRRVCLRRRVPSDLVGLYSLVSQLRPGGGPIHAALTSIVQSILWSPLAAINSGEDRSLHGM